MDSVEDILDVNRRHSKLFVSQRDARNAHRQQHPTGILVTGCMDDRVNFSVITEMPFGLAKEIRTAGGNFDLRAPRFQESVLDWRRCEKSNGRSRLAIVTSHRSKSQRELGCKGFRYDEQEALIAGRKLRDQFAHAFESEPDFYALQCMIETDDEAMVFFPKRGQLLDLSVMDDASPNNLAQGLRSTYPDMPERMSIDLVPFLVNNLSHIKQVRARNRSSAERGHNASVIAVGTGLDWILTGAYVISPADPKFSAAVRTALELVGVNYRKRRRRPIILASASFQPPTHFNTDEDRRNYSEKKFFGRRLAEMKVKGLKTELLTIARVAAPDLLIHLDHVSVVVNLDTRLASVVD